MPTTQAATTPRRAVISALLVALLAVAAAPVRAEPETPPAPTGVPVRLVLPALELSATVESFDLNDDLTMPVPQQASLVAWYTFSARAGAPSNAVLAGHRDWQRQKGVFYDLGRLVEGDDVWLQDAAGDWFLYKVVWTASLEDASAPVDEIVGPTLTPSVTLITCAGVFDRSVERYVERRVVRAELVYVAPAAVAGG